MGYTHYWRREQTINPEQFRAIRADFNKIVLVLADAGVQLGDSLGEGVPLITDEEVLFNGLTNCGHAKNSEISIPWPAPQAAGIGSNRTAVSGEWFAGATLQHRACNGDCSYETFDFSRVMELDSYQKPDDDGLYFQCTKTALRPYDLAVTAFLLIALHHLGSHRLKVSTDGDEDGWTDAKLLLYVHLGYGVREFAVTTDRKLCAA